MEYDVQFPILSVIVNNYNYGRYLPEAIDSALKQLKSSDELVVVDDGSTDESPDLLQTYKDNFGITVINQENQGQMKAVRRGIEAANGNVIVLLDSDDCFVDGYLDRLRTLYRENHDIDFVFCRAQLVGNDNTSLQKMHGVLDRMELRGGLVGPSKWSTIISYEYVGSPTSGLSLRKSLAKRIMELPLSIDMTISLSPLLQRFYGFNEHEARKFGMSADGVIVRAASVLGAVKYYDECPGFLYRIHGSNKYATLPAHGRWYMKYRRKRHFQQTMCQAYSLKPQPTTDELYQEIRARQFSKRLRRAIRVRFGYAMSVLGSQGTPVEKLKALATAAGVY